jgi:hypothetical protein
MAVQLQTVVIAVSGISAALLLLQLTQQQINPLRVTHATASTPHSEFTSWLEEISSKHIEEVSNIYIVPGGGPGSITDGGFPRWTQNACDSALREFYSLNKGDPRSVVFIALSAGSMNAPNARNADGHIAMESTKISEYLNSKGVPHSSIIADFASWDTVANAWVTRMVIESIIDNQRGNTRDRLHPHLSIRVFISDFHARRMQAVFDWIFRLSPSLLQSPVKLVLDTKGSSSKGSASLPVTSPGSRPQVALTVVGVDSSQLPGMGREGEGWKERQEHEGKSIEQVCHKRLISPYSLPLPRFIHYQYHITSTLKLLMSSFYDLYRSRRTRNASGPCRSLSHSFFWEGIVGTTPTHMALGSPTKKVKAWAGVVKQKTLWEAHFSSVLVSFQHTTSNIN